MNIGDIIMLAGFGLMEVAWVVFIVINVVGLIRLRKK
jgi:hypothetical protein